MERSVLVILVILINTFIYCQSDYYQDYQPDTCNYDFKAIFAWTNDKTYTVDPFYFGNWSIMEASVGLVDQDMQELRVSALWWFKRQFGVPIENAIFNTTTNITTVPNWGTLASESFNDRCYSLIATSLPNFGTPGTTKYLVVAEFTFNTLSSAANRIIYGGRFGQLNRALGTVPYVQPADGFSLGYYYIYEIVHGKRVFLKRVLFKSKFPTRTDMPFRINEESYLEDCDWGTGASVLRLKYTYLPNGLLYTVFDGLWKFPEPLDIYYEFGIY